MKFEKTVKRVQGDPSNEQSTKETSVKKTSDINGEPQKAETIKQIEEEIVDIWKKENGNDYDFYLIQSIIDSKDSEKMRFLHHLITMYNPECVTFSMLVDLSSKTEDADFESIERRVKDIYEYRHRNRTREQTTKPIVVKFDVDKHSNKNTKEKPHPELSEEEKRSKAKTDYRELLASKNLPDSFMETSNPEDDKIIIGISQVLDYIFSEKYESMGAAIRYDMPYITEKTTKNCSDEELALLLTNFVLNYKENSQQNIDRHLYFFHTYSKDIGKILNAKICNVPIIEFAKLNNSDIYNKMIDLGSDSTVKTEESENNEYVLTIADILGFGQEKEMEFSTVFDLLERYTGPNHTKSH